MRGAIAAVVALCIAPMGCTGGLIDGTIADKSWTLSANADEALIDPANPKYGLYPNPRGVQQMTVSLMSDGQICANDTKRTWCGGAVQGIPYRTILNVQPAYFCVRVVDIYGNQVRSGCQDGPPPEGYSAVLPDLPPAPGDGSGSGSGGGATPPQPAAPTPSAVELGVKLVIDAVNAGLVKMGLKVSVPMPSSNGLLDFHSRNGDIAVGSGTCADVKDYLKSEFSDDHPGTNDYVFGPEAMAECLKEGRCRVGQLVTRAMADACAAVPPGTNSFQVETGIVGGGGVAVGDLCDGKTPGIDRCVGSPLVLDLAGDGLQLKGMAAAVPFALMGDRAMPVGWLAGSDDALLAVDLDGDGRIASGRELFGEASGGWAPDGFAALARHDANRDGVISAADPIYARLLAWRDNGDGVSQPSELIPLSELGIRSIALRARRTTQVDAFGNVLGLTGTATNGEGRSVPVIDVWFGMGRGAR